ncbi:cell division GTPase FtsZ [Spirosoma lacussanchae]|uniref:hypothetical protein n=1 Tax=Spirosoma lacussanchae TaxID=1884249 RepID=UPI001109B4AE|nr:hypothetical protein [Spirosoma lacussanchae]
MYNDSENPAIALIGLGETGTAVSNQLYRKAIRNVVPILCDTDPDRLRASPIPNKLFVESGRDHADARWHLADAFNELPALGELALIVTDLRTPADCELVPILVDLLAEYGLFTVVCIGLPPDIEAAQQDLANQTMHRLQAEADSLWIYPLSDTTWSQQVDQLTSAVGKLATFGESMLGNVDFMDFKKVVSKARLTLTTARARGQSRSAEIMQELTRQLNQQMAISESGVYRVLLVVCYSDDKPLLVREHVDLSNWVSEVVKTEPLVCKLGMFADPEQGEWLDVSVLIGMPVADASADQASR